MKKVAQDKNNLDDKIKQVIGDLANLDTIEIEQSDKSLFGYADVLNKIGTNPEVAIGTEVGHWKIIELLGQGGMSIVYLVERTDEQIQQQAALKIIPNAIASQSMIDRFVRERQILSDLNHNNIAKLYDAGVTNNDIPWFVMELVQGDDILTFADNNQLNIEQRIILFKQVCDALSYAHAHGVIHRDIKPGNLMVNQDNVIKLLDFGIASADELQKLTMTGAILGTPGYMSPEQAKGLNHQLDRRSDIFSLGVLLYKLLKKDMPFQAESISEISFKIIHDEPTLMGAEIPTDLQAITFKCLEKKVEARYQSVKQLNQDLDAYLNGDIISARRITFFGRLGKKIKKHPAISSLITAAIVATVLGIGYGINQTYETLRKVQIAEKHLSKAQEIKAKVRRMHMMPFHNILKEKKEILIELEELKHDIQINGSDATGLSSFALGSAYLSLGMPNKAFSYLKQAEEKGWKSSELSSEIGLILAKRWWNILEDAKKINDKEKKQSFLAKEKESIYMPAIEYLNKAKKDLSTSNFLSAYIYHLEKDFDKAIIAIEKEVSINPWHYEAYRLAHNIYVSKFHYINRKEGYEVAKYNLTKALGFINQALDIARSDPENYEKECTVFARDIQNHYVYNPDKIDETFDLGINSCNKASSLFSPPLPASIYGSLQKLYRQKAKYLIANNEDASEFLIKGTEILKTLITQYPENITNYAEIIASIRTFVRFKIKQDESPDFLYEQALPYFDKAKQLDPNYPDIWYEMASLQSVLGNYNLEKEEYNEAQHKLNESIKNYKKSETLGITLHSIVSSSYALAALSEINFHNNELKEGLKSLNKALIESEKVIKILPNNYTVYDNYILMMYKYIKVLKQNNMDYNKPLIKSIDLIKTACHSDFIQEHQYDLLKEKLDLYIELGVIPQKLIKKCLTIIEKNKIN